MRNVTEAMNGYYRNYDEDGRLTGRVGSVEFLTTVRYAEKYLKSGMRILEIGAGTGRYSHYFARKGFEVDAVELTPCNIEQFRRNTLLEERVRIHEGNAVDLSMFGDGLFDMTLMLGPMYHLFREEDKLNALREAIRVTKRGGMVLAAYCCADAAIVQAGFVRGRAGQLIADGMLNPDSFRTHSDPKDIFELHRKEDIDMLMTNFDVERLHFVGTDMFAHYIRGALGDMDDGTFELYMKYHFTICEKKDMVGLTNHCLDIFRVK